MKIKQVSMKELQRRHFLEHLYVATIELEYCLEWLEEDSSKKNI